VVGVTGQPERTTRRPRWPAAYRVALLAGASLALGACASSPSMLDPHAPQARTIARVWWFMLIVAAVVYVVVTGLVVMAILRRRRQDDEEAVETGTARALGMGPEQEAALSEDRRDPLGSGRRHDRHFLLLGGIVVPTLILIVLGVVTVVSTNSLQAKAAELHIDVVGEDWWWRIAYPDDSVETANEIHVPVGQRVDIQLTSDNVIHSLWVPQLNGKADVIPGQVNHLQFTAETAGSYRGQCAEFCGIEHAEMAFVVVAQSPADFTAWLAANRAPATAPTSPDAVTGAQILTTGPCAGCHTVKGTSAVGTLGPDLTHVASRSSLAAGTVPNTPAGLTGWLTHTQDLKPGAKMPQLDLTADQVQALVAYLETLR
jgi:cytochrome c oxidase subunit 2